MIIGKFEETLQKNKEDKKRVKERRSLSYLTTLPLSFEGEGD